VRVARCVFPMAAGCISDAPSGTRRRALPLRNTQHAGVLQACCRRALPIHHQVLYRCISRRGLPVSRMSAGLRPPRACLAADPCRRALAPRRACLAAPMPPRVSRASLRPGTTPPPAPVDRRPPAAPVDRRPPAAPVDRRPPAAPVDRRLPSRTSAPRTAAASALAVARPAPSTLRHQRPSTLRHQRPSTLRPWPPLPAPRRAVHPQALSV
jgi:hypothetical protein